MVGGEGTVVVLLKEARAAVRDGDHIHALVRGACMNNDGARKAGYYAPSLTRQSELIASVLDRAGVRAPSPSATWRRARHRAPSSATVEVERRVRCAYRRDTRATGFCGIGSVKANLWSPRRRRRASRASSKSALVLSLRTRCSPTINHEAPNPQIDFANSPFHVVDRLTPLPPSDEPLRAAVVPSASAARYVHAVLEEAPRCARTPERSHPAIPTSCTPVGADPRRPAAVRPRPWPGTSPTSGMRTLADVAFTFQVGRTAIPCRAAFLAGTTAELVAALVVRGAGAGPAPASGALDVLDDDDRRPPRPVASPSAGSTRRPGWEAGEPWPTGDG
ncbi:hypothetical protein LV779_34570 [Streptomyces thinghirensis]|nr:hypothetical protein [Streptomyces thinghirensis]